MSEVLIRLEGGLVRGVMLRHEDGTLEEVPAVVHDYDIEGVDEADLLTDGNGERYLELNV